MTRRRCTLLVGVISISLVVMLSVAPHDGESRPLSEAEMGSIRGLIDACQEALIDWENLHWDCWAPYHEASVDNDCDMLSCTSEGDCGTGTHYSNFDIPTYHFTWWWQWNYELATDRTKSCFRQMDCITDDLQEDKDCSEGWWCGLFDPYGVGQGCVLPHGPLVEGCRPCSEGEEILDTETRYVDPYERECPFEPEV